MKITVYGSATCPYCFELKDWLDQHNLKYKYHLIDNDPKLEQEMIALGNKTIVPFSVIEYDDGATKKLVGFNEKEFEQAISV
jgi:glutaredoxin